MIITVTVTILIESAIIFLFAKWRKKPLNSLLLLGVLANLLTQSLLWIALTLFPNNYLPVLLTMELLIVGIEGFIFYFYRGNHLRINEALLLSFAMNLASFTIGWFLPV